MGKVRLGRKVKFCGVFWAVDNSTCQDTSAEQEEALPSRIGLVRCVAK